MFSETLEESENLARVAETEFRQAKFIKIGNFELKECEETLASEEDLQEHINNKHNYP